MKRFLRPDSTAVVDEDQGRKGNIESSKRRNRMNMYPLCVSSRGKKYNMC